ncbi:MAG: NUDIX domain-containing protein [Patescibacteria group bacterium]
MYTTDPQDEIFPVVNEQGVAVGRTTRREAHRNRELIHPVIGIFVFDTQNRVLLQKRSATKDLNPHCWTLSVGGHIKYGDTPIDTAVREIEEEIGISVNAEQLTLLGTMVTRNEVQSEYWYVYRYDLPAVAPLKAHPDEVAELKFVTLAELKRMIHDQKVIWGEDPKKVIKQFILH